MELLEQFGIDWRTLIAQMINFLVVLLVLWKFAYKPVLKLLQERSKKIEKSLKDAAKIEQRMVDLEETKNEVLKEAEVKGQEILKAAEAKAAEHSAAALAKAKTAAKQVIEKAKQEIAETRNNITNEVRQDVAVIITHVLEKILQEKAASQDEKLVEKVLAEVYSQHKTQR